MPKLGSFTTSPTIWWVSYYTSITIGREVWFSQDTGESLARVTVFNFNFDLIMSKHKSWTEVYLYKISEICKLSITVISEHI